MRRPAGHSDILTPTTAPMPGPGEALAAVAAAAAHGVRIGCFRPSSTSDRISRLRLTAHAHHTDEELALVAGVLRRIVGSSRGTPIDPAMPSGRGVPGDRVAPGACPGPSASAPTPAPGSARRS